MGILAKTFEAVLRACLLPGEMGDDDIELGGKAGKIGGGEGEEGAQRLAMHIEQGVVGLLVRLVNGGIENRLRLPEASKGAAPPSVIPAKAGTHEHGSIRFGNDGVHGSRIKRGMTNKRRRADSA